MLSSDLVWQHTRSTVPMQELCSLPPEVNLRCAVHRTYPIDTVYNGKTVFLPIKREFYDVLFGFSSISGVEGAEGAEGVKPAEGAKPAEGVELYAGLTRKIRTVRLGEPIDLPLIQCLYTPIYLKVTFRQVPDVVTLDYETGILNTAQWSLRDSIRFPLSPFITDGCITCPEQVDTPWTITTRGVYVFENGKVYDLDIPEGPVKLNFGPHSVLTTGDQINRLATLAEFDEVSLAGIPGLTFTITRVCPAVRNERTLVSLSGQTFTTCYGRWVHV